jgi:hypothetical protein
LFLLNCINSSGKGKSFLKKQNMKTLYTFVCLLMLCAFTHTLSAQAEFHHEYISQVENSATCIIKTSDGGWIMTGTTGGVNSFGQGRIVLTKLSSTYAVQWSKNYGGNMPEYVSDILENPDGSFTLTGVTYSNGSQPYGDALLMKVSSSGTFLWTKVYTGSESEYGYSLIRLSGGGYAICGLTRTNTQGGYDYLVIRTDSSGTVFWATRAGGGGNDVGFSLMQASDGNILVLGESGSYSQGGGMMLCKFNYATGVLIWSKQYENDLYGGGRGGYILQGPSGSYYLVGWTVGNTSAQDAYVIRVDDQGTPIWSTMVGTTGLEIVNAACVNHKGGVTLTGETTGAGAGGNDFFLMSVDSTGAYEWGQTYGDAGHQQARCLLQDTDDLGYFIGGTSTPAFFSGDIRATLIKTKSNGANTCYQTNGSFSVFSDLLVVTNVSPVTGTTIPTTTYNFTTTIGITDTVYCSTVSIQEINNATENFTIAPNPSTDQTTILLPEKTTSVFIYDLNGQIVYSNQPAINSQLIIETKNWAAGIYTISVQTQYKFLRQKLVVLH